LLVVLNFIFIRLKVHTVWSPVDSALSDSSQLNWPVELSRAELSWVRARALWTYTIRLISTHLWPVSCQSPRSERFQNISDLVALRWGGSGAMNTSKT